MLDGSREPFTNENRRTSHTVYRTDPLRRTAGAVVDECGLVSGIVDVDVLDGEVIDGEVLVGILPVRLVMRAYW